jgi:hypothetical protein
LPTIHILSSFRWRRWIKRLESASLGAHYARA